MQYTTTISSAIPVAIVSARVPENSRLNPAGGEVEDHYQRSLAQTSVVRPLLSPVQLLSWWKRKSMLNS